jgi:hypothetical protein
MQKWIFRLSVLTIACAQFLMGVTLYWRLYPYEPTTFVEPVPIEKHELKRGESVIYTVDYCWKGEYPLQVQRRLQGEIEVAYPTVNTFSVNGCFKKRLATDPLPEYLPAGKYRIQFIGIYEVNPVRKIPVTLYSEWFEVIE